MQQRAVSASKSDDQLDQHSVLDELAIRPRNGAAPAQFDRDWSCSRCGYNLRGLEVGQSCPECGHVELTAPGPVDQLGYARWLTRHAAATPTWRSWAVAGAAAMIGGVWAIVGTFIAGVGGMASVVAFGPASEEIMKIALVAVIVEVRPYLFKSTDQIRIAAIASAATFAAVENVLYLHVYITAPSAMIIAWRWSVCVALHVGCTTLAVRGVADMWQQTMLELRPPRFGRALPWVVAAIIVHAAYNGAAVMAELSGFEF